MTAIRPRFSAAADRIAGEDAVVEILRLAERPGVISLAGGLPDPKVFGIEETREAMARVLAEHAPEALNYSPNPGVSALREFLAARTSELESVPANPEEVLVVSGGVEGIRHALNALADPGEPLLVEDPTYLATLHIARELGLRPVPVASDRDGMVPEALEETAGALRGQGTPARVLYANPTYSNPTGRTWTAARRARVLEVCERQDLMVIEDHAYAELRYDVPRDPALKALAPERVVFVHTFSKIFGPGLRLGWVVASPELVARFGLLKLGSDQCSGALVQRLALAYAESGALDRQVRRSRGLYRRKRDAMLEALEDSGVGSPTVRPGGGFFLWLETKADTEALLHHAVERHRVAFVAGAPFHADPTTRAARTTLRLSFSHVRLDQIPEAIRRLTAALREAPPLAAGPEPRRP